MPWRLWLRHSAFRRGVRDMARVLPGYGAWGLVTGVAMVKGGLSVPLALFMSLVVFAGSAQLAAVPLMVAGTPAWVVLATAFCVNLRFVIFSAQLRPYLRHLPRRWRVLLGYAIGDLSYVLFVQRYPQPPAPDEPCDAEQIAYLLGLSTINFGGWHVLSVVGIVLAAVIPDRWGLDFAGVLALLGVMLGLVVDRNSVVALAVAGAAAVAAFALPFKLNIVVAIGAAVAAGVLLDWLVPTRPALPPGVPANAPEPPR